MKKGTLRFLLVAGLATAAGVGGTWWYQHRFIESTDNAYVHGEITSIAPRISGYVNSVEVTDNQTVTAGTVLARIDQTDYRNKVELARAAVTAAEAALVSIDRQIDAQQAQIAAIQAGVSTWKAELHLSDRELARTNSLVQEAVASRQKQDTTRANAEKARAGLTQAEAQVEAAKSQIAVLQARRVEQEAALAGNHASLALAESDLAHTVITAPCDGVVGNRAVRLGQYVAPGTFMMSVVPLQDVWIEANFKETQITRMTRGQQVSIEVDAYPGITVTGKVESLSPASGAQFSLLPPQNATGNFTKVVQRIPVRISVPADNALKGALRPGLSVIATVDTAPAP